MTTRAKQLGTSNEHRIVRKAQAAGLRASRQPLSGILKDFPNDVQVEAILVESKVRSAKLNAKGAKTLTLDLDWLHGVVGNAERAGFEAGIVVAKAKGSERQYVLADLDFVLRLLQQAKGLTLPGTVGYTSE
jgi:hypothetical protein